MPGYLPNKEVLRERATQWLLDGISPRRLALTLSLGFVLGCIPVVGVPTGLCAVVALAFRLNQPAIQAANYAAMPFQMALMIPLVRLGGKLTPAFAHPALDLHALAQSPVRLVMHSSAQIMTELSILAGQALLAWFLLAIPASIVLTMMLTGVFRRVPALATAKKRN